MSNQATDNASTDQAADSDVTFAKGTRVREKGKRQIMTVKGEAGLIAHRTRATAGGTSRARQIVCEWRSAKGAMHSKPFLATALELVPDEPQDTAKETTAP